MNPFDKLAVAYALCVGDRLLMGAGGYSSGAIVSVLPDEPSGRGFLSEHREAIESLKLGEPGLVRVGDPWRFMRRAAGEGLAGIGGATSDAFPDCYMFMVRVEEAGHTLPTVLTAMTTDGWGSSLTRTGLKQLSHAELLHWQRYDILDPVSGLWGERCPFREWENGDPLYEIRSEHVVVLLADVPLLGDWNSTEGAFAFFTGEEDARHYLQHHLGDGHNRMLSSIGDSDNPHELMAALKPVAVRDVQQRLRELAEINPFASWCINPDGHRETAGYGRLVFGDAHPAAVGGMEDDGQPRMMSVSGVWKILRGNVFELETRLNTWSGRDTIRWSGGQTLQLLPFDRSFFVGSLPADLEFHDLTESEAEELVGQQLKANNLDELSNEMAKLEDEAGGRLDQFHVVCWDVVTGDGANYPWRFRDVFAALRYLATFERVHDRRFRDEGAVSCMHIGFAGSGSPDFESLRSERFQLGLRRIGLRIIQQGYRPSDADDIVALCNGVLRTLHVDFAGFAKDLLWASSLEQAEEVCEHLEIDQAAWRAWMDSTDSEVDPAGKKLVVSRIGDQIWDLLLPRSRHFLATALLHLERQGHAPQLDYAPISIEIVKTLEVELCRVLENYRASLSGNIPCARSADQTDKVLEGYLAGGKPPTLGSFPYLLRLPKTNPSEMMLSLHRYLGSLPNAQFLTSDAFVKKGLTRVINKYRNGGAHDSGIAESVCRECVDVIVGTKNAPGYLARIVAGFSNPGTGK